MNHVYRTLLAPIFLIVLVSVSYADVVELKTGQRVEGTLKQATPAGVVIEVGGQTITFEQEKVRAIYFGTAPAQSEQGPSTLTEAMKALKGLQSVANAGVNFREYSPRVLETKVVVDRYLADSAFKGTPVQESLRAAMDFYNIANSAWRGRIAMGRDMGFDSAGNHPALASCPKAMAIAEARVRKFGARDAQEAAFWTATGP